MPDETPWPVDLPKITTKERVKIPGVTAVKCHTRKWVVYRRENDKPQILGYVRRHELLGTFYTAPSSDGQVKHGTNWQGPFPTKIKAIERMVSES